MKEIPILFSTPMVQAILDGRKTMTRRIVKPQPYKITPGSLPVPVPIHSDDYVWPHKKSFRYTTISCKPNGPTGWVEENAIWQPGDILWVRESWATNGLDYFRYKADFKENDEGINHKTSGFRKPYNKWKPSIHMPKSACRIWLEVVSVRVERLQEITEQDAIKEGYSYSDWHSMNEEAAGVALGSIPDLPKSWFNQVWLNINGPDSWNANPWVWVIEFRRITPTTTKTEE